MLAEAARREFLSWLAHERRASPLTVEAYARDVGGFLGFLTQHFGVEPDLAILAALRVADLRAWLAVEAKKGKGGLLSSFVAGLTVTLGNPKTMIFYLAITPTIVDLKTITLADYGILVALTVVVLFVVLVPYLALAAKARWFLKSPRALKVLNRTAAGFMVGAAAAIAARQ